MRLFHFESVTFDRPTKLTRISLLQSSLKMTKESCSSKFFKGFIWYVFGPIVHPIVWLTSPFYRLYDAWLYKWCQGRHVSTPDEHRKKVARIQAQVKQWHSSGRKTRMCTAKPGWSSWSVHGINKRNMAQIDVSGLDCIVEVDTANRTVTIEPAVMMGQITTILLARGWTIPVVPEFESLTVGGVICGTGVESSSGRYGFSADTALEYEVVLSNGKVVTCSKDENSDLFYSIPWSHGTLGFLTAVKFPLIPAKKYVELEYHATDTTAEALQLLETQGYEFVEGIAYGRHKFVVTLGNFSDRPDPKRGPVNNINRWYKPFWYKHMESFLGKRPRKNGQPYIEYIPLRDYYHRHTRGYFWTIPLVIWFANNFLHRIFLGGMFPTNSKVGRRMAAAIGLEKRAMDSFSVNYVLQDLVPRLRDLGPVMDLTHEMVEVYPLWLCPCRFFKKPGMVHTSGDAESELYFDFGIYGNVAKSKCDDYQPEAMTRKFEAFCLENTGVQFLYADSYLSRDEFRQMFDLSLYDQVRAKYECLDAFPDVYDKVSKHARRIATTTSEQQV